MSKDHVKSYQTMNQDFGMLQVCVNDESNNEPIENAIIRIFSMSNQDTLIDEVSTNISGQSPVIELPAPPLAYSMEPLGVLPYEPYLLDISAPQKNTVKIYGTQIFPGITALQPVKLSPATAENSIQTIKIGPHTLSEYYSPPVVDRAEKQIIIDGKPISIPDHIVIHTSVPSDVLAPNFCTGYKDYIYNVVANEIYPTWPLETIYANILATLSFTLNRIYTEWYPRQGYGFNVTNTNTFDNKWIYGRNYYKNINTIIDYIFFNFLSKPGIFQPFLTPYCKGDILSCDSMMEKWISKELGMQGYTEIQILRYFFGHSLYINATDSISGVESIWPGENLLINSTGDNVRIVQQYMNRISKIYTDIPVVEATGIYDQATSDAVSAYQAIFFLPVTGVVDIGTWYSILMFFNKFNNRILLC